MAIRDYLAQRARRGALRKSDLGPQCAFCGESHPTDRLLPVCQPCYDLLADPMGGDALADHVRGATQPVPARTVPPPSSTTNTLAGPRADRAQPERTAVPPEPATDTRGVGPSAAQARPQPVTAPPEPATHSSGVTPHPV